MRQERTVAPPRRPWWKTRRGVPANIPPRRCHYLRKSACSSECWHAMYCTKLNYIHSYYFYYFYYYYPTIITTLYYNYTTLYYTSSSECWHSLPPSGKKRAGRRGVGGGGCKALHQRTARVCTCGIRERETETERQRERVCVCVCSCVRVYVRLCARGNAGAPV